MGEFVNNNRRLELHFSHRELGPVNYHVGPYRASHAYYMRELGVAARYPGYPKEPLEGFTALAHDLALANDFRSGDASILQRAAQLQKVDDDMRGAERMTDYVGDTRKRELLLEAFRERHYQVVVTLAASLEYPERLEPSEQRMLTIARRNVARTTQN